MHLLTGPEALTNAQIAPKLAATLYRPVRSVELTAEQLLARLTASARPTGSPPS
ncbi:hypothetical protein [Phytohabitans kaempferiae]|uniref:Uncharacterized protein n=1 Tax=Phytohabitans kaempferiae TaxID=1620943 RepID=A0ABV6MBF7_9ACTN